MHKNNHKLRIGMVGAGNIVRTRHLPALKAKPVKKKARAKRK